VNSLRDHLLTYGASQRDIVLLRDATSDAAIEYADLLPSARQQPPVEVSAVVESAGRPLLYVVDGQNSELNGAQADELAHVLACRGHASYFCVVQPGRLLVYPCKFGPVQAEGFRVEAGEQALGFIVDLQNGLIGASQKQKASDAAHLHNVLSNTLRTVAQEILKKSIFQGAPNGPDEVLALVGRALFVRFLLDRQIINMETFPDFFKKYDVTTCFGKPEAAAAVCHWLDKTFNGELLPLVRDQDYRAYFDRVINAAPTALSPLEWIMARTDVGGQQALWQYINFSFVPVGVLSEVYEDFAHVYREETAREESVHYTPRHIAEPLVEQAFQGLEEEGKHKATVLDPACGAGIFLVLAYRKLAKEHLRITGQRADSVRLRQMLYGQIRGFDISEDALKLAALSLYLTAIELDPDPLPPQKLMFENNLIGSVLRNLRVEQGPQFGSLAVLPDEREHQNYSIVIGNPPWSEWKRDRKAQEENANALANRIIAKRQQTTTDTQSCDVIHYENPDNVPDLPFIWRAMEFARPGGVIALIVHGRLLFKRTEVADNARRLIIDNLRISGILNGADFSDDHVMWDIGAPFCILFAWNRKPIGDETIQVLSPYLDNSTLFLPRLRLDPSRSKAIALRALRDEPYLLKTLYRGTELDLAIMRKLEAKLVERSTQFARLGHYWEQELGLVAGDGYKVGNQKNEPLKLRAIDGAKLTPKDPRRYVYDASNLSDFDVPRLEAERDVRIYQAPITLFPEAPGETPQKKRARLALGSRPIIFCESYIGYSAAGHVDSDILSRYLLVLGNSSLWMFYILMTSSRFGVERRAIYKHDIDGFPVFRLSEVVKERKEVAAEINRLADLLMTNESKGLADIDTFVFDLYRISKSERQIIRDTLKYSLPYATMQTAARTAPDPEQLSKFLTEVERILNERLSVVGRQVTVRRVRLQNHGMESWQFFDVFLDQVDEVESSISSNALTAIGRIADVGAASHIYVQFPPHTIRVGILTQARYWTASRARLRSGELIELIDNFGKAGE
jgi:hypothetical protein